MAGASTYGPSPIRIARPPSSGGSRQVSVALNLRQKELGLLKITAHRGAKSALRGGKEGQGALPLDPDGVPPLSLALRGRSLLYRSRRTVDSADLLAADAGLGPDKMGSGA